MDYKYQIIFVYLTTSKDFTFAFLPNVLVGFLLSLVPFALYFLCFHYVHFLNRICLACIVVILCVFVYLICICCTLCVGLVTSYVETAF